MPLRLRFEPNAFLFRGAAGLAEAASPSASRCFRGHRQQMTTGFPPASFTRVIFLIVGLTGLEFGEHQTFSFPFLFGASIAMTVACVILGVLRF